MYININCIETGRRRKRKRKKRLKRDILGIYDEEAKVLFGYKHRKRA